MGDQENTKSDEALLQPIPAGDLTGDPSKLRPVTTRSAAQAAAKRGGKPKKHRKTLALYRRYPVLYRISALAGFLLLLAGIAAAVIWSMNAGHAPLKVAMIALAFGGVCGLVGKFLPALVVYLGLVLCWLAIFAGMLAVALAAFLGACKGLDALGV